MLNQGLLEAMFAYTMILVGFIGTWILSGSAAILSRRRTRGFFRPDATVRTRGEMSVHAPTRAWQRAELPIGPG